jgi:LacI family transcriptional regulator, repressor for deo operon, udp, cdd, tsx, nupC, and nupG
MSTIKEVAQKAGVSVATVSRVINKDHRVKSATREKVLNAVSALDYTPNYLGRNLRQIRTKKILVLIPSISNQFYSKIIRGIEDVSREKGYETLVCMSHNDPEIEQNYIEMLTTRIVDGMIFLSSSLSSQDMDRLSDNYPVVQCCEYIEGSSTDYVSIDNERAAYDCVSWLLNAGHKSIAFFGSKLKYSSGISREKGYRKAMEDAGKTVDEDLVILEDYSYPGGISMAQKSLSTKDKRPEAIFCISDSMAIGCISELSEKGITVPGEISVMGFDDTSVSKVYCPPISTVAQPQKEIGRISAQMLLERIMDGRKQIRHIILPHTLILRGTTKNKNHKGTGK